MSRTVMGLVLGGALVLVGAGCAQQSSTETIQTEVESPKASSSEAGDTEAQNPEANGKPVVTVSRSPT